MLATMGMQGPGCEAIEASLGDLQAMVSPAFAEGSLNSILMSTGSPGHAAIQRCPGDQACRLHGRILHRRGMGVAVIADTAAWVALQPQLQLHMLWHRAPGVAVGPAATASRPHIR